MSDALEMAAILSADISPFELGLAGALTSAKNFASSFASIIKDGVGESFSRIYKQGRLADSLMSSIQGTREFSYALDKMGIGAEKATLGIRFFEQHIGAALGDSTSKAAKGFKELGLSAKELGSGDPIESLNKFVDLLTKKFPDAAERTRFLVEEMGKAGKQFLPLLGHLSQAREEFRKLSDYTDAKGINHAFGGFDTTKIQMVSEEFTKINATIGVIFDRITSKFSPAVLRLARAFDGMFSAENIDVWVNKLSDGIETVGGKVIDFVFSVKDYFENLTADKFLDDMLTKCDEVFAAMGIDTIGFGSDFLEIFAEVSKGFAVMVSGMLEMWKSSGVGLTFLEVKRGNEAGFGDSEITGKKWRAESSRKTEDAFMASMKKGMTPDTFAQFRKDRGNFTPEEMIYNKSLEKIASIDRAMLNMADDAGDNIMKIDGIEHRFTSMIDALKEKVTGKQEEIEARKNKQKEATTFKELNDSWNAANNGAQEAKDALHDLINPKDLEEEAWLKEKKRMDDLIQARGAHFEDPEEKEKKKKHDQPLGYAIDTSSSRTSLDALRLAHTIQQVHDAELTAAVKSGAYIGTNGAGAIFAP